MSLESATDASTQCDYVDVWEVTSPGQLQDVTMDSTYALGYRSPNISLTQGGNSSPGQGRSVREFEEQMASLRNENFNLKLRLYFLEQKIPGYSSANTSSDGHESLLKQNVDLKVDIEVLKKELQQKQALLCEAAKAMELMEEQQKDNEDKSRVMIEELGEKIQYLEVENKQLEKCAGHQNIEELMGRSDLLGDVDILQKVRELEGQIKLYEDRTEELVNNQTDMQKCLVAKEESLNMQQEIVKQMKFQIDELQEQLEEKSKETSNLEIPKLREELQASKKELADKICQIDMLQESAEEKAIQHEKAIKTIQKLVSRTNELEREIDRLKKSHESQTSMSYMKEDSKKSGIDSILQSDEQLEDSTFDAKIKALATEKNMQIARLKLDIEKKTIQLQNVINKALWDKSREIERLAKMLSGSITPNPVLPDLSPLSASYTDSEYSQALEQNKQLQSMADMLIEKLCKTSERGADKNVQQLQTQLREAHENVEKAQRFSKDYRDMFVVLVSRLEELAGFLDSLLKNKEILGVLATDRRKAMRKAVDSSLEFSRSLTNISVSLNRSSIGENSLEMLLNFTHLLDQTSDKENRTANSLNETTGAGNNQLVEYLQAEVKALKKELEKKQRGPDSAKKERRSLPIRLENQSESEAWSEPDRTVSLARIGLEDSLIVKAVAKTKDCDNTSSDSLTDPSRKLKSKTLDRINQLEDLISQKDNRILEIQCDLVEADNRLKEEAMRRMEVIHELEEYRRVNGMLEIEIATYKEQASRHETLKRDIEIYKRELEEKQLAAEKVIKVREQLAVDLRVAEMKIESMQQDYEIMRTKLENELDQTLKQEKEKQISLEAELLRSHEEELKQIEDKHKEYLAREWVSRVIYEETKRQLEDAQKKLIEAQLTIDFLRESETELNGELIENEKSQRSLKQKLDEATLQSSKIVMERTKAVSEKLKLEAQIHQLTVQLKTIKRDNERFKEENNRLNNKLVMVRDEIQKPMARRAQGNDMSQSGYTSEEVPIMEARKSGGQIAQRSENPSPDLGIESDAGRTSSTDTGAGNVKPHGAIVRPKPGRKLHIVDESTQPVSSTSAEETARAQQAFDNSVDNNANAAIVPKRESTTGHDCAKVDQEVIDLRRKVNRQKRALEDTWDKLRSANRRKEQVERDIRHQILKTNNVLQNVRSNMEGEIAQIEKEIKRDIRLPLMK